MSNKDNLADFSKNEILLNIPGENEIVDFNKVIEQLEKNSTLRLEDGIYLINNTIRLNKSIRLVGEGIGKTIISGGDLQFLINTKGIHHIELEGISFISLSGEPTTLIHAEDITLTIRECAFTGAIIDPNGKSGIGVFIGGKAKVEISNCQFEDNQNAGLWFDNHATANVVENEFVHNETGFAGVGNTSISAVRNHFIGNHVSLALDISSKGNLEGNKFIENRGGILVKGQAYASIINNTFCQVDGPIGLFENCDAHIEGNEIKDGEMSLLIRNSASATITNNIIENNDQGIFCKEESNIKILKNTITHQDKFGILVQDSAKVFIEGNIIKDNTAGVKFQDHSNFTVLRNQITGQMYGILATGNAQGVIHENIIKDNNKDPMGWNVASRENAKIDFDDYKEPATQAESVNYLRSGNQCFISKPADDRVVNFRPLLDQLAPEEEIILESGLYNLTEPIVIDKPTKLTAKISGEVSISGHELNQLIIYEGEGKISLNGLKLSLEGTGQTNVITVRSGRIEMTECSVEGARDQRVNKRDFGAGLLMLGNASGSIFRSTFSKNLLGISVQDSATVELHSNQFIENGYGIIFRDQSKGDLRENEYHLNKAYGLMAYEESELEVNNDKCQNNQAGFGFMHKAKATISDSESSEHEYHGFFIDNDACCVLRKNRSYANEMSGIAIYGNNQSEVVENEIYENGGSGIECAENAQPIINANHIYKNTNGIFLGDNAHLKIKENNIHGNEMGIRIMDEAGSDILQNKIYQNSEGGIVNFSNSKSNMDENEEFENGDPSSLIFMEDEDDEDEMNLGDFFAKMLGSENLSDDPNVAAIPLPGTIQDLKDEEDEEQSEAPAHHEFQIFYFQNGEFYGQFFRIEIGPDTTQEWIKQEEKRIIEEFKKENPDAEIL